MVSNISADSLKNKAKFLYFQITFDRPCDEIRMKIQTENFFGSLISTRVLLDIKIYNDI
jgi:hypothetical protein